MQSPYQNPQLLKRVQELSLKRPQSFTELPPRNASPASSPSTGRVRRSNSYERVQTPNWYRNSYDSPSSPRNEIQVQEVRKQFCVINFFGEFARHFGGCRPGSRESPNSEENFGSSKIHFL